MPSGLKVLNGIFEAVSTRTAGFSSVNLAQLHPAVQFSYMVMMYISVFPIAISVRRTNVYEEKSLGVYSSNDNVDDQIRPTCRTSGPICAGSCLSIYGTSSSASSSSSSPRATASPITTTRCFLSSSRSSAHTAPLACLSDTPASTRRSVRSSA